MVPNIQNTPHAYCLFSPSEECLGHKESRLRKNHKLMVARHPPLCLPPSLPLKVHPTIKVFLYILDSLSLA